MRQKKRNIPRRKWTMEFGDNLMPLWIDVIIVFVMIVLIIIFDMPWELLWAVLGLLIGLDALYYLVKWTRKIDF
jgi:hypothetical protein